MGKRELLLAAVFVVFGIAVYQVTAPASGPSRRSWSIGGIIESMRREIRGNQAQASATNSVTVAAPESVRELRVLVGSVDVTVVGEDRADIKADMAVTSNAYDMPEAERTAKLSVLKVDEAGPVVTLTPYFPEEGQQRATITIKVPARLELRVEKNNALEVTNVATLIVSGRGQTKVQKVAGSVQATQRGSSITLSDIGPLRLTTFGGPDVKVSNVRGDASFTLQSGELQAEQISGGIEIEARNCDVKLDKLDKASRPARINAVAGEVAVLGVRSELRIDGRETDIRVEQAAPAPLSIYSEGERVEVLLPAGGFKIDAMTIDGRVTIDEALQKEGVKVASVGSTGGETGNSREENRVDASVRGGGPMVTVRARRGDIVLRAR